MLSPGEELDIPKIGKVCVVAEIARGGQSQPFKVERAGFTWATPYIVKFFLEPKRPKGGSPDERTKRNLKCDIFERRRRAVYGAANRAARKNRQVIENFGLHRRGGQYYAVFPFVPLLDADIAGGANIREVLTAFDIDNRLNLLVDTAGALAALHDEGLVHGDIKLDNLAVYAEERAARSGAGIRCRLIDYCDGFFEAEAQTWGPHFETRFDTSYASPEMLAYSQNKCLRTAARLSTKSDVFSFGVLALEVLTGKLPKEPGLAAGRPAGVAYSEAELPGAESIRRAVQAALRHDADRRPTSREMQAAFRHRGAIADLVARREWTADPDRRPDSGDRAPTLLLGEDLRAPLEPDLVIKGSRR
ncbi:MAG: protein kinase domain-containing protein [Hyphomicrobiaceae bacterium]